MARDRARGLLFVGIDVIDGYLTKINVTSPTGRNADRRRSAAVAGSGQWRAWRRSSHAHG
jgi:glutathione synthase